VNEHAFTRSSRAAVAALLFGVLLSTASLASRAGDTEKAGELLRLAIPAAAFAMTVRRDDPDGRRQFYRSFAANVGVTLLLKELVGDERPDGRQDDAFPSGHASMAFHGAAFIHRRYGWKRAWPAYALAGFTAWTRHDADEHDEGDVLGGAALGIAAAFLLTDRALDGRAVVLPSAGPGYAGVYVLGRF
jgi:membrane-associated phospholipid phosphatase